MPHSDELRETISEAGSNLRKAASQTVPAAKEQFNRLSSNVVDQTQSIEDALLKRIREKPLNSLLMAAGVGLFAGFFLRRR